MQHSLIRFVFIDEFARVLGRRSKWAVSKHSRTAWSTPHCTPMLCALLCCSSRAREETIEIGGSVVILCRVLLVTAESDWDVCKSLRTADAMLPNISRPIVTWFIALRYSITSSCVSARLYHSLAARWHMSEWRTLDDWLSAREKLRTARGGVVVTKLTWLRCYLH